MKTIGDITKQLSEITPGKWYTVQEPWRRRDCGTWVIAGSFDPHLGKPICESMEIMEWPAEEEPDYSQSDIDLEFIASAPDTIRLLVKALEVAAWEDAGSWQDSYEQKLEHWMGQAAEELNGKNK